MKTDGGTAKWTVTISYAAAARILLRFNLCKASVAVSNGLVKINSLYLQLTAMVQSKLGIRLFFFLFIFSKPPLPSRRVQLNDTGLERTFFC